MTQYNLLVTESFEYLAAGATCEAVRDRSTGEWLHLHYAVGGPIGLVPSTSRLPGVRWDVRIHALGCEVIVGPLIALEKASAMGVRSSRPPRPTGAARGP